MNRCAPHILPFFLAAILSIAGCSFEPPASDFDASAKDQSGALDMRDRDQRAARGDMPPTIDLGHRDMPSPPDMQPAPTDMTITPLDEGTPSEEMAVEPDLSAPVDMVEEEDMAPEPMFAICGGDRKDLLTDPSHCGACDRRCDTSVGGCEAGECVCDGSGLEYCEATGRCADTQVDPNNCGACGEACVQGEVCKAGVCTCRADLRDCDGQCVNTFSDPRHCGGCGIDCEGNACRAGECRGSNSCGLGWTRCREHGGSACIRNEDQDGVLHCRPGKNLDFTCGERCEGDETCIKPDTFAPYQCRPYRPGRGCTSCPCADCRSDEWCSGALDNPNKVWCIDPD